MGAAKKPGWLFSGIVKYIETFFWGGCMLVLCACSAPQIHKTQLSVFDDVPLMPFEMSMGVEKVKYAGTSWDSEIFGKGYLNIETLEIVIPAQYEQAGSFTGNFAIVQKRKTHGKKVIINRGNEIILSGFDEVSLYESEHGDTVFALTRNDSRRRFFEVDVTGMFDFFPYAVFPSRNTYRLYNLSTGALLKKDKREQYARFRREPEIMFVDKYLIYDDDVYEILENGRITKSIINKEEAINKTIEERNLQKKEYGFHFNKELNFDPYFWYMDMLDIDMLIQNIPENMRLRGEPSESDWRFKGGKPMVYYIDPINRELTYPLKINNLLYEVELENIENSDEYIGLYNSSENNWAVPPIKQNTFEHFYQTEYKEWVTHFSHFYYFYNIKTRKKYRNMFRLDEKIMLYRGYDKAEYKEEGDDFGGIEP